MHVMKKEKIKVYIYSRVSTAMQTDGYSLDAQKTRARAYAEYNGYQIAGEYEDAGKSGKDIEGRTAFVRMIDDIKNDKDGVSFVLVFKLSRFGRNAADILSTLQTMQDYGVNLICVDDGLDSSKEIGKVMISIVSAVAEMERENILIQTMEGRLQKAREGKWNGGFAPYGYKLIDGFLEINDDEAQAVRMIYDLYVHKKLGLRSIAHYLDVHGIHKQLRNSIKGELFSADYIKGILKNPIYCGKIAYGRRKTEKIKGSRKERRVNNPDGCMISDGIHQPLVSVADWEAAQMLLEAKRNTHSRDYSKAKHVHLLSGIVKCPMCGASMYGIKSVKRRKDGTAYKAFYYYGCKHRRGDKRHKCTNKKNIPSEIIETAVAEIISSLISKPSFAALMQQKINMQIDTSVIEQEIEHYEKQLRRHLSMRSKIIEELDALDPDEKHYHLRKADLDKRLDQMYDNIQEAETILNENKAKKQAIEADKITGSNIFRILTSFDKLYSIISESEKRGLLEALISEIQVYPEQQPNGQWIKSIKFKLPIIENSFELRLDYHDPFETVMLFSKLEAAKHIDIELEMDELDVTKAESEKSATYEEIKAYVLEQTGLKVSSLYVAQIKQKYGIIERECYNKPKSEDSKQPICPKEKEDAIKKALKHFNMLIGA